MAARARALPGSGRVLRSLGLGRASMGITTNSNPRTRWRTHSWPVRLRRSFIGHSSRSWSRRTSPSLCRSMPSSFEEALAARRRARSRPRTVRVWRARSHRWRALSSLGSSPMATSGSLTPWSARNRSTVHAAFSQTRRPTGCLGRGRAGRSWTADTAGPRPQAAAARRIRGAGAARRAAPPVPAPRRALAAIPTRAGWSAAGRAGPCLDDTELVHALGETAQVGLLDLHLEPEQPAGAPSPRGKRPSVRPVALDSCAAASGLRQEQLRDGPRGGEGDRWGWQACPQQVRGPRDVDAEGGGASALYTFQIGCSEKPGLTECDLPADPERSHSPTQDSMNHPRRPSRP